MSGGNKVWAEEGCPIDYDTKPTMVLVYVRDLELLLNKVYEDRQDLSSNASSDFSKFVRSET